MSGQNVEVPDDSDEVTCAKCEAPIAPSVKPVFGARRSQISTLLGDPWQGVDTQPPMPFHPWHFPPDDDGDWVRIR